MNLLKQDMEKTRDEYDEKVHEHISANYPELDQLLEKKDFAQLREKFKAFCDSVKKEKEVVDDICESLQPFKGRNFRFSH